MWGQINLTDAVGSREITWPPGTPTPLYSYRELHSFGWLIYHEAVSRGWLTVGYAIFWSTRYLENRRRSMTSPDSDIDPHIIHHIRRLHLAFRGVESDQWHKWSRTALRRSATRLLKLPHAISQQWCSTSYIVIIQLFWVVQNVQFTSTFRGQRNLWSLQIINDCCQWQQGLCF